MASDKPDKEGPDVTTTAPETDSIVQFGGRIPQSLRRRVRIAAAAQDKDAQTVLREALEEYVTKRGF